MELTSAFSKECAWDFNSRTPSKTHSGELSNQRHRGKYPKRMDQKVSLTA